MARSRHLNRVAVFLKRQNPATDAPSHYASRALASLLSTSRVIHYLDEKHSRAQLRTSESWREIKARFRGSESGDVVQKLHAPLSYYGAALAAYPPVPRNERERHDQEDRWLRAVRF